ncbi:MAG: carboxypeptidase regulatory-like domain-containing protein [Blastocatellia bacterium]|nr:carboxypeptidase regulatory-like domain-containing protein [Blastocatellia bacterium]
MNTLNRVATCLATMLMTIALVSNAWSQVGASTVTGTVTDQQGNAVAGATVNLIGAHGSRAAVSNENGLYTFKSVTPGEYRLEVEATGFKKASVSPFKALTEATATINVSVEVGNVTETVNVEASALESIVNTQDASLGNNFVGDQIVQLPLLDRNVANLLSLQPGVTPDGSVNGGRADQANITLDGIDMNNQQNAAAFEPVFRVNPDSIGVSRYYVQP